MGLRLSSRPTRISDLGMGDILSLIEEAEQKLDKEKAGMLPKGS